MRIRIFLFRSLCFVHSKEVTMRPNPSTGETPFLTQIRTQQTFSTIFVPREMSRQFEREVRFPSLSSPPGSRDHGSRSPGRSSLQANPALLLLDARFRRRREGNGDGLLRLSHLSLQSSGRNGRNELRFASCGASSHEQRDGGKPIATCVE